MSEGPCLPSAPNLRREMLQRSARRDDRLGLTIVSDGYGAAQPEGGGKMCSDAAQHRTTSRAQAARAGERRRNDASVSVRINSANRERVLHATSIDVAREFRAFDM